MSRKRRVFEIDLPEDMPVAPEVKSEGLRKGPMASAIAENAEALQARKSAAEQIRDENDALAHEYVALREAGQVVDTIPLDQVHTDLLVRDRLLEVEDSELQDLVTSIRDIGLSNPIRVVARPGGDGYELVQGYRRLSAYRQLHGAEGQGGWAQIPALILSEAPDTAGLYRRMVDENIVRKDLSFAEMAHVAQVYLADPSTEAADLSAAVAALFQSAPYSKRSYIRSFAALLDTLGSALRFPTEVPRALGVSLARLLKDQPDLVAAIRSELARLATHTAETELALLRGFVDREGAGAGKPYGAAAPEKRGRRARTKTTFHIKSAAGQIKCTAAQGRLEIKADRDFSSIERTRLEAAIASLIEGLS
ncbi:MAG: ParB N-terminal domain-containing protein [Silicimonas sp.]|nr:ParB N-terminal domain-containing protein [Silicimonas sp.]